MANEQKPIVLMYHGVIRDAADIPPGREPGASLYDVREADFREQVEYLQKNGYHVVRMDAADVPAARRVVLTFDDGEANNFLRAFPVLSEYGCPAYFFVTPGRVGTAGYMGWEELRGLCRRGMFVGSHGLNHRILTQLGADELYKELAESKRILEERLEIQADALSVPRGFCDEAVIRTARQAGYQMIFVSDGKDEDGQKVLARTAVKGSWSLQRFADALDGKIPVSEKIFTACKQAAQNVLGEHGYDWVRSRLVR